MSIAVITVALRVCWVSGSALADASATPHSRDASALDHERLRKPGELHVVVVTHDPDADAWLAETARAALVPFEIPVELRYENTLPFSEPSWAFRPHVDEAWSFWLDVRQPGLLLIFVADARRKALLVRALQHSSVRSDPVLAENLTEILYASTEGLLSGGELGVSRPPSTSAPRPAELVRTPRADVETRRGWELSGAAFYFGELFAAEQSLLHGPGASAGVRAPGGEGWRLFARATANYANARAESEAFAVSLDILRAYAILGVERSTGWHVSSGLGVGFDASHIDPSSSVPNADLRPARWSARALLRAEIEVGVVAPLVVGVSSDFELTEPSYAGVIGSRRATVLDVHRVRPGLRVGVSF